MRAETCCESNCDGNTSIFVCKHQIQDVNIKLKGIWKEAIVDELSYDPIICVEELRRRTNTLRIVGVPTEIRTDHLPLPPASTCSVEPFLLHKLLQ